MLSLGFILNSDIVLSAVDMAVQGILLQVVPACLFYLLWKELLYKIGPAYRSGILAIVVYDYVGIARYID